MIPSHLHLWVYLLIRRLITVTGTDNFPCPSDEVEWTYLAETDKCLYKSPPGEGLSYPAARDHCQDELQGALFVITDDTERLHLQNMIDMCPAGELCRSREQYWIGIEWEASPVHPELSAWTWIRKSDYDYRHLTRDRIYAWPDGDKKCLRIKYDGLLHIAECEAQLRYICKREPIPGFDQPDVRQSKLTSTTTSAINGKTTTIPGPWTNTTLTLNKSTEGGSTTKAQTRQTTSVISEKSSTDESRASTISSSLTPQTLRSTQDINLKTTIESTNTPMSTRRMRSSISKQATSAPKTATAQHQSSSVKPTTTAASETTADANRWTVFTNPVQSVSMETVNEDQVTKEADENNGPSIVRMMSPNRESARLAFYIGLPLGIIVILLVGGLVVALIALRQKHTYNRSRFKRLVRLTPIPSVERPASGPSFLHPNMWQDVDPNSEDANLRLMAFLQEKVGNYDPHYVPHPLYPEYPRARDYPDHVIQTSWGLASHAAAMSPEGMRPMGGSSGSSSRSSKGSKPKQKGKSEKRKGGTKAGTSGGGKDKNRPSSVESDKKLLLDDSPRSSTVALVGGVVNESSTDCESSKPSTLGNRGRYDVDKNSQISKNSKESDKQSVIAVNRNSSNSACSSGKAIPIQSNTKVIVHISNPVGAHVNTRVYNKNA